MWSNLAWITKRLFKRPFKSSCYRYPFMLTYCISSVGDPWHFGADPDPGSHTSDWPDPTLIKAHFFRDLKGKKNFFHTTLFFLLWEKRRIRKRIRTSDYRIREAQKHADPKDPDPQHCIQLVNFLLGMVTGRVVNPYPYWYPMHLYSFRVSGSGPGVNTQQSQLFWEKEIQ